ncbi:hypothetical protein Aple_044210 [Acrocarpospora pleiomorpha]|uniref:Uncharacterized protein n=1 Tax=Acrocarpospora pleiomorpha TaxID=90975 RepID=A0A5M3XJ76_9ACTN|nr:hypothetical protein Aple_044210 [Acrocarpospora pleiomorpha]
MHGEPVVVVVAAMLCTTTSWLLSGLPRQFIVMWQNNRCSTRFHLEVPGVKWQIMMAKPASAAKRREFGLPRAGAVSVGAACV